MKFSKRLALSLAGLTMGMSVGHATPVEIARLAKAKQAMPEQSQRFSAFTNQFAKDLAKLPEHKVFAKAQEAGQQLWYIAKTDSAQRHDFDDRPLYWARLAMYQTISNYPFRAPQNQANALQAFADASRGYDDNSFSATAEKRILVTGFDPFLLDKNIRQSNPSGVAAMLLDGRQFTVNGEKVEVQAMMIPVRFRDFDQGLIERLLAPLLATNSVDLLTTISMGRDQFDLERFPGKRRSSTAPDNENQFAGGDKSNPVIGKLGRQPLSGPEFVEFSLPVNAMKAATGNFTIVDNHQVTTNAREFTPDNLSQLADVIAVEGSGGGYLSNEISYRSIRLRDLLHANTATGHIHTPRVSEFDSQQNQQIVEQIEQMLTLAIAQSRSAN